MSINYDFGDLEAFLAVKNTGSFHAAAEHLNLSQSAITRRVRKLELALDSVLFERTTRAVKPTLAAKRLQARAEAILDDAHETARAMRDESVAFAHQRGAVVTLAVIPSVLSRLVLPALGSFRAAGHSARLRLLDGSANEVAEAVSGGEADFGLCPIPLIDPQTVFEPLFDDPMVLAAPRDHDLARSGHVKWRAVRDVPLILPARGTGNRLLIDEAMAKARQPLRWTFEVGRTTTALDLVESGFGVAPLPRSAISRAGVATCELTEPGIARPVGLLSRLGHRDTNTVAALKDAIRAAI
ncbi:MAG: LysR family transcriptional regulator [Paracoccaceae bacterium]